jgi:hypothetical protein
MTDHKTGTREECLAARAELLKREKELTRMSDELARQRRELPWVPVEKEYTFQTADGPKTLAELFDGRSQLVVYRFMFGPDYAAGCPTNSSIADSVNGVLPHLEARDVTMICAARKASRLQAPDGLELQLGVEPRERLQLRLRRISHRGGDARVGRADARGRAAAADRQPERQGERHRHRRLALRGVRRRHVRARERHRLPQLLQHLARRWSS